ncbi:MAG: guanylate kinase [Clostridia bacterium]|jgi:guanylate kinase|nr:guanylate kinase [Clostridia bacterium]
MKETRKGMLLVISGPSGAGKGTLVSKLLDHDPSFSFSVSVTTRGKRENEIEDVHYHFISESEYDKLLEADAFIEHATVHGHRYGTLKSEVYERMEKGQNVLLDIDPQGARAVMEKEKECVSIFILPPSYHDLKVRLHTRNTEKEEEIARRLGNARGEIAQMGRYRYLIVNDDLELAFDQLMAIVRAEKQNSVRYFPVIEE